METNQIHSLAAEVLGGRRARFFPSSELHKLQTWEASALMAEGFELGAIWAPKEGAVATVGVAVASFPCKIGDGKKPSPTLHGKVATATPTVATAPSLGAQMAPSSKPSALRA